MAEFKDWAEIATWLIAALGGLFAAWRGLVAMRMSRQQRADELQWRQSELRWRQAREAKELLNEMEADVLASNAMQMLDWSGREYEIAEGQKVRITDKTVHTALRTEQTRFDDDAEVYIRDCFDHFFDWLEQFEHFVTIGLVLFDDLKDGVDYYAELLARNHLVYHKFMSAYNYDKSLEFLNKFPAWTDRLEASVTPEAT